MSSVTIRLMLWILTLWRLIPVKCLDYESSAADGHNATPGMLCHKVSTDELDVC